MRYASAAFVGLFVLAGCVMALSVTDAALMAAQQGNPIPASEESIAKGRQIFQRFCRSCHGAEGKGDGGGGPDGVMPANLVDDKWDHGGKDPEIFKTIKEGVPPDMYMEPWEGRITDDDIWNTINYIRELGKRAKAQG
jgi:mono/diheme cytochrome c family protein